MGILADRGHRRAATGATLAAVLVSWAAFAFSPSSIVALVVGLLALDFGVQGQQVLSQHAIYGLGQENASRVTTAYMTANFTGGAIGSAAGSIAWGQDGWTGVCIVGVVVDGIALAFWLTELGARRPVR
jgi:predicted MFS family arabinose efflux permease